MKKKEEKSPMSRFSNLFDGIKENVTEGAKALSQMSADLFEEVKDKAEELYEAGSEKFEQASGVVEDYMERYKGNKEVSELSNKKNWMNSLLGDAVFHEFKKNGTISKRFLLTNKMTTLIGNIEKADKRILQLGKKLDQKK